MFEMQNPLLLRAERTSLPHLSLLRQRQTRDIFFTNQLLYLFILNSMQCSFDHK